MKNTLKNIFHSPRFVVGFVIFVALLLMMLFYPLFNPGDPLERVGVGTFARPGTYVSMYDATSAKTETFRFADAEENRVNALLSGDARTKMLDWMTRHGDDVSGIDPDDTDTLMAAWKANYEDIKIKGMTNADRVYFRRLNNSIVNANSADALLVMEEDPETGEYVQKSTINNTDYVNTKEVANVKTLPLGTDNFGRDTLRELVSAAGVSLRVGLIAGCVATLIGLSLGLLAGYLGGAVDDVIMFITNIFTVIPSFVLLILISYSISQDLRGASLVAVVIGFTGWTWTCRSVRSQVISLRNRDHVNLSKLSGHSMVRIILTDILPYIASYVVMAFILQVSAGILAEAQLSMLGLGPKTTETPTLGLMMNWAMLYSAHTNGSWWAYFPVILTITLISFSLNLMNTGLDQVFNPTLRD